MSVFDEFRQIPSLIGYTNDKLKKLNLFLSSVMMRSQIVDGLGIVTREGVI